MAAIYEVSQITAYLRELLAYDDILADIWIEGEVSNLRRPGSGHAYFTLRDSQSSLRGVLFRNSRGLEHLRNGAAVVAHGRVTLYEVRGDLQLIADIIQPEGIGELQMRLERLTLQLEQEGLFDPSRKRSLPAFPKRVGVVTSPSGSVWRDIQSVIGRRWPLAELLIAPSMVQGDGAAATIVEGLAALNAEPGVDVIIVARGGGSLEDLWPFNEEAVARAVFASAIPVISAIGHETDFTICDMAADARAPTPSAAAELIVPDQTEMRARMAGAVQLIENRLASHVGRASDDVSDMMYRAERAAPELDSLRLSVDDILQDTRNALVHRIELSRARLSGLSSALSPLSPYNTLRRGYAIVSSRASNRVLTDSRDVTAGDTIDITLHQGKVSAKVESRPHNDLKKLRKQI